MRELVELECWCWWWVCAFMHRLRMAAEVTKRWADASSMKVAVHSLRSAEDGGGSCTAQRHRSVRCCCWCGYGVVLLLLLLLLGVECVCDVPTPPSGHLLRRCRGREPGQSELQPTLC